MEALGAKDVIAVGPVHSKALWFFYTGFKFAVGLSRPKSLDFVGRRDALSIHWASHVLGAKQGLKKDETGVGVRLYKTTGEDRTYINIYKACYSNKLPERCTSAAERSA